MPATRSRIKNASVSSSRWPEPLARAYAACEALAQSHYENFPVASRLLPAPMRPHVAAVYAFARVADDIADEGTRAGRRAAGAAARLAAAAARGGRRDDHGVERVCEPRRSDVCRARPLDPLARSAARAVRRSAERVRSGYHDDSLRLVARRARLLPPLGESGRPSRAAHRRLPRRRARSIVRRAVHGAAADELLAGLRARLARRPPVRAARGACDACGAREAGS